MRGLRDAEVVGTVHGTGALLSGLRGLSAPLRGARVTDDTMPGGEHEHGVALATLRRRRYRAATRGRWAWRTRRASFAPSSSSASSLARARFSVHIAPAPALAARATNLALRCVVCPGVSRGARRDPRRRQAPRTHVSYAIGLTDAGAVARGLRLAPSPGGNTLMAIACRATAMGIPRAARTSRCGPFTQADASVTRRYAGIGSGFARSNCVTARRGAPGRWVRARPGATGLAGPLHHMLRVAGPQAVRELRGAQLTRLRHDADLVSERAARVRRHWH